MAEEKEHLAQRVIRWHVAIFWLVPKGRRDYVRWLQIRPEQSSLPAVALRCYLILLAS
jgi:hypothetical protein